MDHRCISREECKCGVIVPYITFFTSTYLGHIETCTRNHSHGKTLNVLTSAGSMRGCSGYEVVLANVIRIALCNTPKFLKTKKIIFSFIQNFESTKNLPVSK